MAKLKERKLLPMGNPSPIQIARDVYDGKSEEVLDVRVETVAIPKEALHEPETWMPKLFEKIETAFVPKMGYDNSQNLALTLPLVREIRGDYKTKQMLISVIAVDVTPVIKAEAIYD